MLQRSMIRSGMRKPMCFAQSFSAKAQRDSTFRGQSKTVISSLEALDAYVEEVGAPDHPIVEKLREETVKEMGHSARLLLDRASYHFLTWHLKKTGATRILEVGTFTGATALGFAFTAAHNAAAAGASAAAQDENPFTGALAEPIVGLDAVKALPTACPLVLTLELDPTPLRSHGLSHWSAATAPSPAAPALCLAAPAVEALDALVASPAAGTFDLVFVDADKHAYPIYYERALQMLRPGGVVALDNVLRRGAVLTAAGRRWNGAESAPAPAPETAAEILDGLNLAVAKDPRVEHCLLPVGDGLLLATKRSE